MTDKPSDTPPPPIRTAYLVLGMHRSGTSALANLLALAGADLPRDVMPADEHNARGYFEPWRIAVFNDRRLAAAGSAWDDPFAALAPPRRTRTPGGRRPAASSGPSSDAGDDRS